jgi:very-short-patch-repair endonuclease
VPRHNTPTRRYRGATHELVLAARQLRNAMTPAEEALWQAIRGRQVAGARFRRQHPIGPFILDFCCPEQRLVIEVDGAIHDGQQDYDAHRTLHLESYGYRVLRFRNEEVMHDLDSVIHRIAEALNPPAPLPLPLGRRGEGGLGDRGPTVLCDQGGIT